MKKIPFATKPNQKASEEIIELGNNGTVKILKKGGISYNEKKELDSYIDALSSRFETKPASSSTELQMRTITFAFQYRIAVIGEDGNQLTDTNGKPVFGDNTWTFDDTILNYEENVALYDQIFEFINSEKLGWKNQKYLAKYEGLDAEQTAKNYADLNGLIAASDGKYGYIFKLEDDVPSSFVILNKSTEPETGIKGKKKS